MKLHFGLSLEKRTYMAAGKNDCGKQMADFQFGRVKAIFVIAIMEMFHIDTNESFLRELLTKHILRNINKTLSFTIKCVRFVSRLVADAEL